MPHVFDHVVELNDATWHFGQLRQGLGDLAGNDATRPLRSMGC